MSPLIEVRFPLPNPPNTHWKKSESLVSGGGRCLSVIFYNGLSSIAHIMYYVHEEHTMHIRLLYSSTYLQSWRWRLVYISSCIYHLSLKTNSVSGSQTTLLWVNYHSSQNATKATVGVIMEVNRWCREISMTITYRYQLELLQWTSTCKATTSQLITQFKPLKYTIFFIKCIGRTVTYIRTVEQSSVQCLFQLTMLLVSLG